MEGIRCAPLIEKKGVKHDSPVTAALLEQEEKAAICFVIYLDAIQGEAAGDGHFHFRKLLVD